MSTFNRDKSLPEEVDAITKDVEEMKQAQIIGSDNLVVRYYSAGDAPVSIAANTTAIFKGTFTFNTPTNAYVDRSFSYRIASGVGGFVDTIYDDPATIGSTTAVSWYQTLTPTVDIIIDIAARVKSTNPGTITYQRVQ